MTIKTEWLTWTARKIARRGPGYLPRRVWSSLYKRWVDRVYPTDAMSRRTELRGLDACKLNGSQFGLLNDAKRRWHWTDESIPEIVSSISDERKLRTIDSAEQILDRKFIYRGVPRILARGEWEPRDVSRNWIWDLNRHHWLATLGFAYHYTSDERFLESFTELSSDWMDSYLHRLGRISWDTPFEVASRVNAWLWAYFLFRSSPHWSSDHREQFLVGIGLLTEYLYQTLEYHCPGNHVLLEAKALAIAGEALPQFVGSENWRREGWRVLWRELQEQVCADGVHVERSTMYHRIIAGELSELWVFCVNNNLVQQKRLAAYACSMACFQSWIDQGHGVHPLFGDAHLGDTYYRFSAPAIGNSDMAMRAKYLSRESTDHSYWLLGTPSTDIATDAMPTELSTGKAFDEGGYFIARSDWTDKADVLVWDCGPTGYRHNMKHAHLDTLSFTLSVGGTPLLIDPGVHESASSGAPLRSARFHNCVYVDGQEPGLLAGRGEIWAEPNATLTSWATSSKCTIMAGSHDGYSRFKQPVIVKRTIIVMHGLYWLIHDFAEGSERHTIEQRFHIAPGALVTAEVCGVTIEKDEGTLAMSWPDCSRLGPASRQASMLDVRIESSTAELFSGRPEPSHMVTAQRSDNLPMKLVMVASARSHDIRAVWREGSDPSGSIVVTGRDFEHELFVATDAPQLLMLPAGWTTDAQWAIVERANGSADREITLPRNAGLWTSENAQLDLRNERNVVGDIRTVRLPT